MKTTTCSYTQTPGIGFTANALEPTINQAILQLEDTIGWSWYGWTKECFDCHLVYLPIQEGDYHCAIVSSTFPYELEARRDSDGLTVKKTVDMGHRGTYAAAIDSQTMDINITTVQDPVSSTEVWGPLVSLLAVLCLFVVPNFNIPSFFPFFLFFSFIFFFSFFFSVQRSCTINVAIRPDSPSNQAAKIYMKNLFLQKLRRAR
jgi:hypothetical protein